MTKTNDDFWRRFDELDHARASQFRRRESAIRQLSPSGSDVRDPSAVDAWREYCESIGRLEQSIADLEHLLWNLK